MLTTILIVGAVLLLLKKKSPTMGKLSDPEVSLDNILRGVERGWYKARSGKTSMGYVVYLSGTRSDGTYTEDVYPISETTYNELQKRGI